MLKLLLTGPALLLIGLFAQSPSGNTPPPSAVIPASAAAMPNPVKPTTESQAFAKKMYGYDCAMCHGATGDGKGEMVASMKLTMADLSKSSTLASKTDGELFYIIKNGSGQMPGENGRQNDTQIWNMVSYVRSLGK